MSGRPVLLLVLAASAAAQSRPAEPPQGPYTFDLDPRWRLFTPEQLPGAGAIGRDFAARLAAGKYLEVRAWDGDLQKGPILVVAEDPWVGQVTDEQVRQTREQLQKLLGRSPETRVEVTAARMRFGDRDGVRAEAVVREPGKPARMQIEWRVPTDRRLLLFTVMGTEAQLTATGDSLRRFAQSLRVTEPPPPEAGWAQTAQFVGGMAFFVLVIALLAWHYRRRRVRDDLSV